MGETVRWLKEVTREDAALVGHKAARLGELYKSGIVPVLDGFIIPANVFQRALFQWDIQERLHNLHCQFLGLTLDDFESVSGLAREYASLLTGRALHKEIAEEITTAFCRIGCSVAVRSSAPWEDSERATFAGVFETKLGIETPVNFLRAVQECWASLYSPRALYYVASMGLDIEEASMAVLTMEMVPAQKAGVLYTNWQNHILIESCAGLGEPLVSGDFSPDQYILDRSSGRLLSFTAGNQREAVIYDHSGMRHEAVDGLCRLTEAELNALADIARRVEDFFDGQQDVEWAIAQEVYVLQSRPLNH